MNEKFKKIGFYPADILLPTFALDSEKMSKWSVIACDQFSSQPEYWEETAQIAGDAPSTLRLILNESLLTKPNVEEKIAAVNKAMNTYLDEGVFDTYKDSIFYIERTLPSGKIRRGIIGAIDLENYDFTPGCGALIRATEGTVLSRIPPRVRIRKDAPLELPHIMLLIDDPDKTVIEPLANVAKQLSTNKKDKQENGADSKANAPTTDMHLIYDFELMQGGGHIKAFALSPEQMDKTADALLALTSPAEMQRKYGLPGEAPLLFAVGDGNHSLATAKKCYEDQKAVTPPEQWESLPSRYALVEIVNNHDDALVFKSINRVVFGCEPKALIDGILAKYPDAYIAKNAAANSAAADASPAPAAAAADTSPASADVHLIRFAHAGGEGTIVIPQPKFQLAVGTLQNFLDECPEGTYASIDYVHGDDVSADLGRQEGNIAFILPAMSKDQLFKTVIADGVLPRKTFSMGDAREKRYYTEARALK